MTVNAASNTITYAANGSTTVWAIPFPPVDADFIHVTITDSLGAILIVPAANYTVTINPPLDTNPTPQSGSVLYPKAGSPLAVGNSITITRILPAIQDTSIANQSIIYPPIIEQEFDYLTLLHQEGSGESTRAFRVPPIDPTPAFVPPVTVRANKAAFFDSAGNLTAGVIPDPGVAISAAMVPVVSASTLTLARDAMGVPPINNPVFTGDAKAVTPPLGDNDTSIATTEFVQTAVATSVFTTGDIKLTHKTVADLGWILWGTGSIGDVGSGATIRALADTLALFTLYYNGYTDTNCPLLTSTGAATTRAAQGTAATAFGAKCRMTLPRGPGRVIGVAGAGAGLTTRAIGDFLGEETHTQTVPELAAHNHTSNFTGLNIGSWDGYYPVDLGSAQNVNTGSSQAGLQIINSTGSSVPFNIMQPTTFLNVMIRL